jgi:ElaB/YqjD/DUF883 family membrane-anchored ribosome-binding protein
MASLADDLRTQVSALDQARASQAQQWEKSRAGLNKDLEARWSKVAEQVHGAAQALAQARKAAQQTQQEAAQAARSVRSMGWKQWGAMIAAGALSGVLTAASWTWLRPSPPPAQPVVNLDARTVAQYLMQQGGLTCRTEQRRR